MAPRRFVWNLTARIHRAVSFVAEEDCKMGVGIEALFTSALGLQAPWSVEKVELDTARRRIDFQLTLHISASPA